ncbi:hypothetical protein AVEN_219790-1 [Araneus ventricosus]|uniref:Uncharacterized protein n=1 Tax=Araneus ventricosus TaxID=182803 RepID=A0A4Y2JZ26_ARAVE|nr:hypothetical protein AVEN_219790-1 [Araneus ventricosus]
MQKMFSPNKTMRQACQNRSSQRMSLHPNEHEFVTEIFIEVFLLTLHHKISSDTQIILLQTWKVASQRCESYGWKESFAGITSSSHVWFPDLGDKLGDLATNLATLETKYGISKVLESSRYFH